MQKKLVVVFFKCSINIARTQNVSLLEKFNRLVQKWLFLLLQVALFADCGYEQEVNILISLNRSLGSCSWMPSGASVQAVGCRFLEVLLIKTDWLFFVL